MTQRVITTDRVIIVTLLISNILSLGICGYLAWQIFKGQLASTNFTNAFAQHTTGFQNITLFDKTKPLSIPDNLPDQTPETNARMLRLGDSLLHLRNTINQAMGVMNDSLSEGIVMPYQQQLRFDKAFLDLSLVSTRLSMQLDSTELAFIKAKGQDLTDIIKQFDPKIDQLNKISKTLTAVAQYVGIAVNVFSAALGAGITVGSGTQATVSPAK